MTRILSAALAVMLALSLAACGDDDPKPKFQDPPTTPSTPTPPTPGPTDPPTPTEPPLPDAATKDTKAGAIAFTKYYWDLVEYAQLTGDTATLRRISLAGCDACDGGADSVEQAYKEGARVRGGRGTFKSNGAAYIEIGKEHGYQVAMTRTTTRQVIDYPGKSRDEIYPASTIGLQFLARRDGAEWRVAYWRPA